tara:strand:- start:1007 stop:2446 length:1440 start_codon:yes stop_codon:yes gene_type:complete
LYHRGQIVDLYISEYAFGGKGISKIPTDDGHFIVFVQNAFPGQNVRAKISKKRKNHAEANLVKILQRSEKELETEFQEISGGPYIRVPIDVQKEVKMNSSLDVLTRISGLNNIHDSFDEWIPSPDTFFYRNKMEYSFSSIEHCLLTDEDIDDSFALGFKRRGTWWKVESLKKPSGLFDKEWESKVYLIQDHLKSTNLPAWHPPKKEGFFRHLVVRKSFDKSEFLINLVTSSEGISKFNPKLFVDFILSLFGEKIAGIQHTVNDDHADRSKIENGTNKLLWGRPIITQKINNLDFEISMESFFQTNPRCAEKLYNKSIDYVIEESIDETKFVLDLFCGTGTIGQLLAKRNQNLNVIGVDIVSEAIDDANRNAIKNKLNNLEFFASDVGKFLKFKPELVGKINTIILDPPRAGIAPKTLVKVMELGAKHIVYISCNPSTQARDASSLADYGYVIEKITLVDQFPHTGHIESIIKFKSSKQK